MRGHPACRMRRSAQKGDRVAAGGKDALVEQPGHRRGPGAVEAAPGVRAVQGGLKWSSSGIPGPSRGMAGALPQKSKMSSKLTVLAVKKVNKARAKPTFGAKPPEGEGGVRAKQR